MSPLLDRRSRYLIPGGDPTDAEPNLRFCRIDEPRLFAVLRDLRSCSSTSPKLAASWFLQHRLEQQHPKWSDLHLARVQSSGTVHTIYRLGKDMAVRLPRLAEFTVALERETGILPILGPLLPLSIPELVAVGAPTNAYPSSWSILKWIEGETMAKSVANGIATATRLGKFVAAMRAVRVTGAQSTNQRGQALARSNGWTRDSIQSVAAEFDPVELTAWWEAALAVPE